MRYYFKLTKTIIKMEIQTLKDLKNWIAEAEEKYGTDNANLNLFVEDTYKTAGFHAKVYKNEMFYNTQYNTVNMYIHLSTYVDEENVKITSRKKK